MRLPHWLGHRWGKWHSYSRVFHRDGSPEGSTVTEIRQRRQCLVCGRYVDEALRECGGYEDAGLVEQLQRERVEDSLK